MVYRVTVRAGGKDLAAGWFTDYGRAKHRRLEDLPWTIAARGKVSARADSFRILAWERHGRNYGYGIGFSPVLVGSL